MISKRTYVFTVPNAIFESDEMHTKYTHHATYNTYNRTHIACNYMWHHDYVFLCMHLPFRIYLCIYVYLKCITVDNIRMIFHLDTLVSLCILPLHIYFTEIHACFLSFESLKREFSLFYSMNDCFFCSFYFESLKKMRFLLFFHMHFHFFPHKFIYFLHQIPLSLKKNQFFQA